MRKIALLLMGTLLLLHAGCQSMNSGEGTSPSFGSADLDGGLASEIQVQQPENGMLESGGETAMKQSEANDIFFDFETRTVMLNSGYEMPINGIGTYSLLDEVCVESVSAALACGVRLIDTAHIYNNEASVGDAVRNSGVSREEIFVITKLSRTSLRMLKSPSRRRLPSWTSGTST